MANKKRKKPLSFSKKKAKVKKIKIKKAKIGKAKAVKPKNLPSPRLRRARRKKLFKPKIKKLVKISKKPAKRAKSKIKRKIRIKNKKRIIVKVKPKPKLKPKLKSKSKIKPKLKQKVVKVKIKKGKKKAILKKVKANKTKKAVKISQKIIKKIFKKPIVFPKKIKKSAVLKIKKSFLPAFVKTSVGRPEQKERKAVPLAARPKESIFDEVHKTKIRVIGIGGGGGTIVSEIISRIKKVDFYVANTDVQALRESAKTARRFQFGYNLTRGLGTGTNVAIGEQAALEEKDKIESIFEGQDLCIIISCLGGGTSSGAAPVFAKISRSLGNITYGIFTLPFEFEGERKMEAALEALEKIKPNLNVYTVIPNERIFQIVDKNTPLRQALSAINKNLAENLEALIETIYLPGLINIDFADLKTILSGRGRLVYLNTIETGELSKEEAIRKLISSPLYPYTLKGAKGILYNITGGSDIQLDEVSQISNVISELVNKNAKIIFGISQNQKYHNKIKVLLLASGCSTKEFFDRLARIKKSMISSVKKIKNHMIKKTSGKIKRKRTLAKKEVESKTASLAAGPKKAKKESKSIPQNARQKTIKIKITEPKTEKKEAVLEAKPVLDLPGAIQPSSITEKNIEKTAVQLVQEPERIKIRRNALEVRRGIEEEEREILEREKAWEIPAILRRKK